VLLHALDAALGVNATEDDVGANVHVVLGGGLVADERVRRGLVLHVDVVRADEELGSLGGLVRGRVVEVGVAGAITTSHLRRLVAVAVPEERVSDIVTRKRQGASRNSLVRPRLPHPPAVPDPTPQHELLRVLTSHPPAWLIRAILCRILHRRRWFPNISNIYTYMCVYMTREIGVAHHLSTCTSIICRCAAPLSQAWHGHRVINDVITRFTFLKI